MNGDISSERYALAYYRFLKDVPMNRRNMTDLLLSELLALLLLLPVLLRPFSKGLKKGAALPILPFLSLFVCICIVVGQGIVLFLFILSLFALIVCISETIRLVAFFQGMLNDFYGIASIILRAALLLLFCGMMYLAFRFAPEASVRTVSPLTIRNAERTEAAPQPSRAATSDTAATEQAPVIAPASQVNPIESVLIERQGGADKKALVIVAEAFPASGRPGALASLLADTGYTVLEITQLKAQRSIPRTALYGKLLRLIGKKEQRFLAKETDPQTAAFFSEFLKQAISRYGRNKRLFLYAEGVYTDLAAQFCAEHPGTFTGVFFRLSEEEPLPQVPEDWVNIIREEAAQLISGAGSTGGAAATALDSGSNAAEHSTPAAPAESAAADPATTGKAATGTASVDETLAAKTAPAGGAIEAAPLPFCCFIQPYSELAGFGSLRAEDILAAELLGSGRSIGRKDKAAAAAAFDRYAVRL